MSTRQIWSYLAGLAIFCFLLYVLRGVLLPFVAGALVAYFLDPVADRLEAMGCSRTVAVTIITASFFILLAALILLLVPMLQSQITGFIQRLPDYLEVLRGQIQPLLDRFSDGIPGGELDQLRSLAKSYAGEALKWLGQILSRVWAGGMALVNLLSLIIIMPLVAFYMLRDWDRIVERVDSMVADFATLDVVFCGAEKLPMELAEAFEKKFGVRPTEGYGTTELSPVVAANIPPSRAGAAAGLGVREGTVGRTVPGVSAKVVDLETGEDLGTGKSGMLLIKGPNVMKGYLGEPELTAKVVRDGWYTTGDIAVIDEDGFIQITGRQSRFSKIGGEMVPHIRVEEAIGRLISSDEEVISAVVAAVPDARKGERLVVLHTGLAMPPEQICRELGSGGLPPIWIPSPESFCQVDAIPVLGTGKLDLRQLKEMANRKFPSG